jgi:hypothetical protein
MNTPILSTELEPSEQKRRAAALKRATKICRALGFRSVAAKPGWWFHEQIGPEVVFALTRPPGSEVASAAEVIEQVFVTARAHGVRQVRADIRAALGL